MIDVDLERAADLVELADDLAEEMFDLEAYRRVRGIDFESVRFAFGSRSDKGEGANAPAEQSASVHPGEHRSRFFCALIVNGYNFR